MSLQLINGIFVFIIGTVFGSFYNVVGYRVPNNMSISFPASHCPNCNHKLKFYELIPIFSYIFLRGKCFKCKEKISLFYPFFEFLTGISFLLSYIVFGFSFEFLIAITFLSILIIITISDLKYYIIPDEVLIVGIILIIVENIIRIIFSDISIMDGLIFPLLSALASFLTLYLFKLFGDFVFKKESLGGGDIKLLFFIGLVLGYDMSIVTIFIASFIALPLSVVTLIKENKNVIPFGPYLSFSAAIILLLKLNLNLLLSIFTA